jgi:hypothetical protein
MPNASTEPTYVTVISWKENDFTSLEDAFHIVVNSYLTDDRGYAIALEAVNDDQRDAYEEAMDEETDGGDYDAYTPITLEQMHEAYDVSITRTELRPAPVA